MEVGKDGAVQFLNELYARMAVGNQLINQQVVKEIIKQPYHKEKNLKFVLEQRFTID